MSFEDLICERVDLCNRGENPYLIHEFENSFPFLIIEINWMKLPDPTNFQKLYFVLEFPMV